jgi:DHA1 family bicyclomycin/chloramphenicol resistance-like MFS transporter
MNAVGYIAGTQANARLVARVGIDRALTFGSLALVAATTMMLSIAVSTLGGPLAMAFGMMACMASLGFLLPGAALGSVLGHTGGAGSASALYGTTVFFIGALSTVLVGWTGSGDPVPMTALMLAGAMAALVCDRHRPR